MVILNEKVNCFYVLIKDGIKDFALYLKGIDEVVLTTDLKAFWQDNRQNSKMPRQQVGAGGSDIIIELQIGFVILLVGIAIITLLIIR